MAFCRCRTCGHRRTLDVKPERADLSLKRYQCRYCVRRGVFKGWRVDKWRHAKERGKGAPRPCMCGGFCDFNLDMSEDDWRAASIGRRVSS